ncbi:MAG: [FeFe] hydrogenase H-cluster maturation GTPase HydF [Clostridiales bacterium]|nr:[FeFe] hydrogenase H-cluster maturation GTPase HydF [Clostridiales bacterium]
MGLNDTPAGNRIQIGFFGRRNAGKSSLVNAVTGQQLSVVSEYKGTTTDPVYKAMELLPLGPVMIIDTPGMDDEGELGELRIEKTKQVIRKIDIAILVVDGNIGLTSIEEDFVAMLKERQIPYIIAYNKADIMDEMDVQGQPGIWVSAVTKQGVTELKEKIAHLVKVEDSRFRIVGDLLHPLDFVILVIPIDSAAPKGRLILPQQQVIRDILEAGAIPVVTRDTELQQTLNRLGAKPYMVITDSQAFKKVAACTPDDIYLTSFSILMARWKGFLSTAVQGVEALSQIEDGDKILIAEGCTHHRQCEDIGTVKLPQWIRTYTGREPEFVFCSGTEFPEDLHAFKLVVHCGGCMLNEKEMRYRMQTAVAQQIPFTNYGILIAHMNGILERSIEAIPVLS